MLVHRVSQLVPRREFQIERSFIRELRRTLKFAATLSRRQAALLRYANKIDFHDGSGTTMGPSRHKPIQPQRLLRHGAGWERGENLPEDVFPHDIVL